VKSRSSRVPLPFLKRRHREGIPRRGETDLHPPPLPPFFLPLLERRKKRNFLFLLPSLPWRRRKGGVMRVSPFPFSRKKKNMETPRLPSSPFFLRGLTPGATSFPLFPSAEKVGKATGAAGFPLFFRKRREMAIFREGGEDVFFFLSFWRPEKEACRRVVAFPPLLFSPDPPHLGRFIKAILRTNLTLGRKVFFPPFFPGRK